MRILVVESDTELGELWCNHLSRQGGKPTLVADSDKAIGALRTEKFDVLVLDLMLPGSCVLAVADFATYRWPEISVLVVSANSFFSGGSVFDVVPNARGFLSAPVQADDLAALVDHYGRTPHRAAG